MKVLGFVFFLLVTLAFAEEEVDSTKRVAKRGALYSGYGGYGGYGYGHGYGYGYAPVVSTAVVHTPVVAKTYYGGLGHGYYGGYGGYGGHYGLGHGYYPAYSYSSFGLGHGLGYGYYGHGWW
ncbi:hypothetical protein Trydic_g20870 [Trypoxylus dichotomus]